ncbi:MAG: four helix bundle protein [Chloroflexota bacterium]
MGVMNYSEWLEQVPDYMKQDGLWDMEVYRKALFVSDLAWFDCEKLLAHPLGRPLAWQLIRSVGSIPANMEEGFGRDYGRFLKIALGSARESKGWYYRSRQILHAGVIDHRSHLLITIIAGLITMAKQQYSHKNKP